jgi:FAD/FMN-containing dehydrogenase/Fe-S oxidoreductase
MAIAAPQLESLPLTDALTRLASSLHGELHTGDLMRRVYATDASAYQEMPLAVAIPKTEDDIAKLIQFANQYGVSLIPRTAGTSLAGQVVGAGVVVDVSKHFTKLLEVNADEKWVRVQPGVIRNELNMALADHQLMFGPETSTQNRAMIGGMVGNNSCGSNSVRYGSVRDHLLEVKGFLSDGTQVTFGPLTPAEFEAKCRAADSLETRLYCQARDRLGDPEIREEIFREFPKSSIPRRNTGYALDLLMDATVLDPKSASNFNFCRLIAGSEGTLFFATEIKLRLNDLLPPVCGLLCAHFENVADSLEATLIAIKHDIYACELIDDHILECTRRSIEHRENRFFIEGQPKTILVTEVRGDDEQEVAARLATIEAEMRAAQLGYAFPTLFGDESRRVWDLRKAGLGLLSNTPGDEKPVPVIEDTAVAVEDLPAYIGEFDRTLKEKFGLECVHYAHAGSGEIHLRPILNLKTVEGNQLFRDVAQTIADLVKKYRGSLSGEHGDGRLRGEFLRQMIGPQNYALVTEFKTTWDPHGIFNPGKIVNAPKMNESLRFDPETPARVQPETYFDFSESLGILGAAEMCNGSGDCRKTHLTGGTMCPSYMATRNEQDTTRARANTLRQILTTSTDSNPFDNAEIHEVMDLCLSCKGCKAECPSTVDVGKMKAEFLQHYYTANGIPFRTRVIANYVRSQRLAAKLPWLWNFLFGHAPIRRLLNRLVGFHPARTIPKVKPWRPNRGQEGLAQDNLTPYRSVYLFCDEFTEYSDSSIGDACLELLKGLGYQVVIPRHEESGRSSLSKGLLKNARTIARANVMAFKDIVSEETPLIGIEPSAILGFRDEYPELVGPDLADAARKLGEHCLLFEEWFAREIKAGRISADSFTSQTKQILVHGHCHQKALGKMSDLRKSLTLPINYTAELIPSGCCGMAGAFGYEAEHYDLSQQIGELVLLPAVRAAGDQTIIAASGTSCRHQIHDATDRHALHSIEILRDALKSNESVPR